MQPLHWLILGLLSKANFSFPDISSSQKDSLSVIAQKGRQMAEYLSATDVLVIIDMQNIFVDGAGAWEVIGYQEAESVVEKIRADFPGKTVFTKFVADPAELGIWKKYYDSYPTTRLPKDHLMWDLTINLNDNDRLITVPTFSKWGTELSEIVGQNNRIVMVGVATDCCVISTALAAIDAGREVLVIEDACAGTSIANHNKAMEIMGLLGPMIRVVNSSEFINS